MPDQLLRAPPRVALAGTYPFKAGERHGSWWSASQHLIVGLDGDGFIEVAGRAYPLIAGSALAVPWGATITFVAGQRRGFTIASIHLVCLPWNAPEPGFPEHGPAQRSPPAPAHGTWNLPLLTEPAAGSRAIAESALQLAERWREPASAGRELYLRGAALQLVAVIGTAASPRRVQAQAGRIRDLVSWMQFNFRRPISRVELARRSGLGQTALGAAFKAVTGCSPTAFLIRMRLDEGRRLLRTTTLPVAEVAGLVGLDDPAYFSRLFSRRFGVPPRHAR